MGLTFGMSLPVPLHHLALTMCHLSWLCYAVEGAVHEAVWRIAGKLHTLMSRSAIEVNSSSHSGLIIYHKASQNPPHNNQESLLRVAKFPYLPASIGW
jgi:hypothetical protein